MYSNFSSVWIQQMCLYVCAKEEGNKIYAQQSFLTYISPLIGDSQLKRVSTEGIDSSTSRPLQNTDPSHLEKFWVKHILHKSNSVSKIRLKYINNISGDIQEKTEKLLSKDMKIFRIKTYTFVTVIKCNEFCQAEVRLEGMLFHFKLCIFLKLWTSQPIPLVDQWCNVEIFNEHYY